MNRPTAPEQAPSERVTDMSARIAKAIERAVPSGFYGVVGEAMAWSRQRFTKTMSTDPKDRVDLSLCRAACLPIEMRVPVLQEALGSTHMIAELPVAGADPSTDLDLVMRTTSESGDVVRKHLEALRDGHMSRAEGAELVREVNEAIAVLLTVRARGELAMRETVIGMPLRAVKS